MALGPINTVGQTSTTLTTSASTVKYGTEVKFTATVAAAAIGVSASSLTGNVIFTIDGTAETPVAVSDGVATLRRRRWLVGRIRGRQVTAAVGSLRQAPAQALRRK